MEKMIGRIVVLFFFLFTVSAQAIEVVLPVYVVPQNGIEYCLESASEKYKIPLSFLLAIAKVESNFNPYALHFNKNNTTDVGLLQINSVNIKRYGYTEKEVYENPCLGIFLGARYLRECINRFGMTKKAIACYHSLDKKKGEFYALKVLKVLKTLKK